MSDAAILQEEDPDEFRSPFDLGLDSAGLEAFKWLVAGHILFAIGLAAMVMLRIENGGVLMTPLFAIPLIWKGRGHRLWAKIAVLIVAFTAAHWLAAQVAQSFNDDSRASLIPGLVGGGVGAAISLALCAVAGLLRPGVATLVFAVFATALLACVGSLAIYLFQTTGAHGASFVSEWVQMLKIYTPWQIAFAYVLARLLRPDG